MSSRSEHLRRTIINSESRLKNYSKNSEKMKLVHENERHMYREDKVSKAERRRRESEELDKLYSDPNSLQQYQVSRAAARIVFDNGGTRADREYIRGIDGVNLESTVYGLTVFGAGSIEELKIYHSPLNKMTREEFIEGIPHVIPEDTV